MGFVLANTTFATKANDALATVDAYAVSTSKVINLISDITNKINLNSLTGLLGGNLGKGLALLSKTSQGGLNVSPDALLKGLLSSNSGLVNSLKSLPADIQANVLLANGSSSITATINGITSTIKNADLTTLKGVGNLIAGVSGTSFPISFTDNTGLINLGSNIVKQASALGIPNAFTAFSQGLTDKSILSGIAKTLLPTVISGSDLNLLANIASSAVGKDIVKLMPSFTKDFVDQFTLPAGASNKTFSTLLTGIDSSLTQLNSGWKSATIGTDTAINMAALNSCSRDMSALITAKTQSSGLSFDTTDYTSLNTSVLGDPLAPMCSMKAAMASAQLAGDGVATDASASLSNAFPSVLTSYA